MKERLTLALVGNPNSGKTTLFNSMTGSRQHVGNYPGVTVEKKEGLFQSGDTEVTVVDLPGTYSLTAYSIEELVARNFIVDQKPDVVVSVIDASNLERNLYLALQVMELGRPVVLAFNMSDVARQRGLEFNLELLSSLLGAPIVETIGHQGSGIGELLSTAVHAVQQGKPRTMPDIQYGQDLEEAISRISRLLKHLLHFTDDREVRWTAIKLLETDKEVTGKIPNPDILTAIKKECTRLEAVLGDSAEMIIADRRYGFISGACQEAVRSTIESRHTRSDRIDEIVIHRLWGLPIFLGLMYLVFWLTFTVGTPPMEWLESLFGWLGNVVSGFWPQGSDSLLKSLLVDGIIAGVGRSSENRNCRTFEPVREAG